MNHPISSADAPSAGVPALAPTPLRKGVEPRWAAKAIEPSHQSVTKRSVDTQSASISKDFASSDKGAGSRSSRRAGSNRPACATGQSSLDEFLDAIETWLSDHQAPVPKLRKERAHRAKLTETPPVELTRTGPPAARPHDTINSATTATEHASCQEGAEK